VITGKDIEQIYTHHVDALFTYGKNLGFNREVVEDAIHDVFEKLAFDKNKLDNVSDIRFYLYKSIKNRLIDIHKYQKEEIQTESTDILLELPFNITVSVENILIEQEEKKLIKNEIEGMLNTLTDRQREVIYLRYVQEYTYEQIAELMQINVHSCRKLVSKAIVNLREKFGVLIMFISALA
jgi:RNA polymerase sigma factor (sigma-70 family)